MEGHSEIAHKELRLPISAIVLTYNEEKNICACLESVLGWVEEIFIVDSYSTDETLEIARKYTDKVYQHAFENYSNQRNWALEHLPIKTEWVLNLDADHRVTEELRNELLEVFSKEVPQDIKGMLASRRTIFMGRQISHGGHYPVYHAVLFRYNFGFCEKRLYDQHFCIEGKALKCNGDIIDVIGDSLNKFVERHNKWATLEAVEQLKEMRLQDGFVQANAFGNPIEKRRFLRNTYNSFPLFIRPFLYFIYRYFFRFGFLDGKEGLIFHFLQGFWFRFLVDAKIYEIMKY